MHVCDRERTSDGVTHLLAEMDDRSGGYLDFTDEQLPLILERVRAVKVTKNKEKSARRMHDEVYAIEADIRNGVFGK
jgi:hypothetical protein